MKTIAQELNIKEFPFVIKDKNDREIYFETEFGFWRKKEYNKWGFMIYYENSVGTIIDRGKNNIPSYTMEDLWKMLKHKFVIKKSESTDEVYGIDATEKIMEILHKELKNSN